MVLWRIRIRDIQMLSTGPFWIARRCSNSSPETPEVGRGLFAAEHWVCEWTTASVARNRGQVSVFVLCPVGRQYGHWPETSFWDIGPALSPSVY